MHLRETSDIIVLRRPKVKRLHHPTTIPPHASDHPAPPPRDLATKTKSAPEGTLSEARPQARFCLLTITRTPSDTH